MKLETIITSVALLLVGIMAFVGLTAKDQTPLGYQNIPGIAIAPTSVSTFTQGGGGELDEYPYKFHVDYV